jgi:uncharacterized protein with HEPN domain
MSHDVRKYLLDVQQAIVLIRDFMAYTTRYEQYADDLKTQSAVERQLMIAGEAIWQANKLDAQLPIRDKEKIIGFRHILVHSYDQVFTPIVWSVLTEKLDELETDIEALLQRTV